MTGSSSPRLKLRVGRFEIHRMDGLCDGEVWIRDTRTGQGGAFSEKGLEAVVDAFFEEHF